MAGPDYYRPPANVVRVDVWADDADAENPSHVMTGVLVAPDHVLTASHRAATAARLAVDDREAVVRPLPGVDAALLELDRPIETGAATVAAAYPVDAYLNGARVVGYPIASKTSDAKPLETIEGTATVSTAETVAFDVLHRTTSEPKGWTGLSGAPVMDGDGSLVAIVNQKHVGWQDRLNAVSAPAIARAIRQTGIGLDFEPVTPVAGPFLHRAPPHPSDLQGNDLELLRDSNEAVPFVCDENRRVILDDLDEWCPKAYPAAPDVSVRVLHGPAGVGKSRLATEWGRRLTAGGAWEFQFADTRSARRILSEWNPDRPTVLAVDYAEHSADRLNRLLHNLLDLRSRRGLHASVRLLLLSRTDIELDTLFGGPGLPPTPETGSLALEPFDDTTAQQVLRAARASYGEIHGREQAVAPASPTEFRLPLEILVAALLEVQGDSVDQDEPGDRRENLLRRLVHRETRRYGLYRDADGNGLPPQWRKCVARLATAVTLTEPTREVLLAQAEHLPGLDDLTSADREYLVDVLSGLYTVGETDGRFRAIEPDAVATAFVRHHGDFAAIAAACLESGAVYDEEAERMAFFLDILADDAPGCVDALAAEVDALPVDTSRSPAGNYRLWGTLSALGRHDRLESALIRRLHAVEKERKDLDSLYLPWYVFFAMRATADLVERGDRDKAEEVLESAVSVRDRYRREGGFDESREWLLQLLVEEVRSRSPLGDREKSSAALEQCLRAVEHAADAGDADLPELLQLVDFMHTALSGSGHASDAAHLSAAMVTLVAKCEFPSEDDKRLAVARNQLQYAVDLALARRHVIAVRALLDSLELIEDMEEDDRVFDVKAHGEALLLLTATRVSPELSFDEVAARAAHMGARGSAEERWGSPGFLFLAMALAGVAEHSPSADRERREETARGAISLTFLARDAHRHGLKRLDRQIARFDGLIESILDSQGTPADLHGADRKELERAGHQPQPGSEGLGFPEEWRSRNELRNRALTAIIATVVGSALILIPPFEQEYLYRLQNTIPLLCIVVVIWNVWFKRPSQFRQLADELKAMNEDMEELNAFTRRSSKPGEEDGPASLLRSRPPGFAERLLRKNLTITDYLAGDHFGVPLNEAWPLERRQAAYTRWVVRLGPVSYFAVYALGVAAVPLTIFGGFGIPAWFAFAYLPFFLLHLLVGGNLPRVRRLRQSGYSERAAQIIFTVGASDGERRAFDHRMFHFAGRLPMVPIVMTGFAVVSVAKLVEYYAGV
ncbi:trypsin-like serine peptidase [Salininema proteolyticum]|uniref:Trypsin-like serine peptidase n=1 Tax=Salininema proteolyticum TaxID=1607685 RepID=A0ABV8TWA1_9ACTN